MAFGWVGPTSFAQSAVRVLDKHVAIDILDNLLSVDLLDVFVKMVDPGEAALFAALWLAGAAAPAFGAVDATTT